MAEGDPTTAIDDRDREHLSRALELAEGGRGTVAPNPLVGAVIVRDARVIGEGFHAAYGELHAERAALADCERRGEDPRGATMYVTLEPCAHHGRQPPCADALRDAGIARLVYAADDPSEKTSGRGPALLAEAGVVVEAANGEVAGAARLQTQPFRKHVLTGRPLVTLKLAMTLDGRTATARGDSQWISGPESRARVHGWRAESGAVAVGIGTAVADDPLLTARDVGAARQPTRVVFDSHARLPLGSKLLTTLEEAPVLVICSADAPPERVQALSGAGAEVLALPGDGSARVGAALAELGERDIDSVLLEGGATLAGSFLDAGEVDVARIFIAPILLGGAGSRAALGGADPAAIADGRRASHTEWSRSGEDLLVSARMREW